MTCNLENGGRVNIVYANVLKSSQSLNLDQFLGVTVLSPATI